MAEGRGETSRQSNMLRKGGSGKSGLGEQGETVLLRVAGPPPGTREPGLSLHWTREKLRNRAEEGCVHTAKLGHRAVLPLHRPEGRLLPNETIHTHTLPVIATGP